jgi:hypothetical protein
MDARVFGNQVTQSMRGKELIAKHALSLRRNRPSVVRMGLEVQYTQTLYWEAAVVFASAQLPARA